MWLIAISAAIQIVHLTEYKPSFQCDVKSIKILSKHSSDAKSTPLNWTRNCKARGSLVWVVWFRELYAYHSYFMKAVGSSSPTIRKKINKYLDLKCVFSSDANC